MGTALPVSTPKLPDIEEWDDNMLLSLEKESLGFYVTGHPLDKYQETIQKYTTVNTVTIQDMADGKMIRMGGFIKTLKVHKTKKGDMMAFSAIEDQSGSIEVVVFPNLYAKTHTLLDNEEIVILEAEVQKKENSVKLVAEKMIPIERAADEWTNGVLIKVIEKDAPSGILEKLKSIIEAFPGDCTACLKIELEDKPPVLVKLSDYYKTSSDPSFFARVDDLLGKGASETRCAPVKEKQKKKKPWLKN
jgi:DNA polymerase-3 subunit alpha